MTEIKIEKFEFMNVSMSKATINKINFTFKVHFNQNISELNMGPNGEVYCELKKYINRMKCLIDVSGARLFEGNELGKMYIDILKKYESSSKKLFDYNALFVNFCSNINDDTMNDIETLKKSYPEYYIKSVCMGKPTGNYSKWMQLR